MSEIEVVEYRSSWPQEFQANAEQLQSQLAGHFTRIDHIGSTSVPGLAAKDVLDIQIAVPSLMGRFVTLMTSLGYKHHPDLKDSPPPNADPNEWQKQVFTEPPGSRRLNIHVRRDGAANMRQTLLFRDFLRENSKAASSYGDMKRQLSARKTDREAYYQAKDPFVEILLEAAEAWAEKTGWRHD